MHAFAQLDPATATKQLAEAASGANGAVYVLALGWVVMALVILYLGRALITAKDEYAKKIEELVNKQIDQLNKQTEQLRESARTSEGLANMIRTAGGGK